MPFPWPGAHCRSRESLAGDCSQGSRESDQPGSSARCYCIRPQIFTHRQPCVNTALPGCSSGLTPGSRGRRLQLTEENAGPGRKGLGQRLWHCCLSRFISSLAAEPVGLPFSFSPAACPDPPTRQRPLPLLWPTPHPRQINFLPCPISSRRQRVIPRRMRKLPQAAEGCRDLWISGQAGDAGDHS